ncbi:hypothetical protein [Brevibacillus sp. SAFN-007a]|uniref:hypothetical protein n=1 Tax=Brevibacillus sp. SAFN-007a TaxID=3436862 RepID=UPI003F81DF94
MMFGIVLKDLKIINNSSPELLETIIFDLFGTADPTELFFRVQSKGYYSGFYLDYIGSQECKTPVIGVYVRTDNPDDKWRIGGQEQYLNIKQKLIHICHEYGLLYEPRFVFPSKSLQHYKKIYFQLKGTFGEIASCLPVLYGIKANFPDIHMIVEFKTPRNIAHIVEQQIRNERWIDSVIISPDFHSMVPMCASDRMEVWDKYNLDSSSLFYDVLGPISLDPKFPVSTKWNPTVLESNKIFAEKFLEQITKNKPTICFNLREKPFSTGYTWRLKDWYDLITSVRRKIDSNIILIGETTFGKQSFPMDNFNADPMSETFLNRLLQMDDVYSLMDNTIKGIDFLDVHCVISQTDLLVGFLSGYVVNTLVSEKTPPVYSILPSDENQLNFRRKYYIPDFYLNRKGSRIGLVDQPKEDIAGEITKLLQPTWMDVINFK